MNDYDIAVTGVSCHFPGAPDTDTFWENLKTGRETITALTDEQLEAAGVDRELIKHPGYVKAAGFLEGIELFDAGFFDYSPREASMIDPQQRLFLELAWKALEDAGYAAEQYPGLIGVFAGTGMNTYLYNNLQHHTALFREGGGYHTMVASDKDFLATRVSYKLNLKGPAITLQTACSTSLVAVHLACQSIRNGDCDMALAGGVSLRVPHKAGYLYKEGIVLSPDGHCRAFDAGAAGTALGNGAGVVVLKLLQEAIEEGDHIYGIIKGSAVNNDGALKAGYTAPSPERQAAVISEALQVSGIKAEEITYVETHGTGTPLGDPVEIKALTDAFKLNKNSVYKCAIGSVKTNIGHMDVAAGIGGFIKTLLCLKNRQIPASLHFKTPNPVIDFENSPFYVNTKLADWKAEPRRAGVSSFGIGGTNAHVILEEAPAAAASGGTRHFTLLPLSAKSHSALAAMKKNLGHHLQANPEIKLADAAFTLALGRKTFNVRNCTLYSNREEATAYLSQPAPDITEPDGKTVIEEQTNRKTVFLFPGQGVQYVNMGKELYETEPCFKRHMDRCFAILQPLMGMNLHSLLYPEPQAAGSREEKIHNTACTQPLLFALEYSLAQLWMEWGINPTAVIGHSIGEYTAACLADIFSLEEALALVAARGRLIAGLPAGSMLAVALPEKSLLPLLTDELSLAAVNGDSLCVVSGTTGAVSRLETLLNSRNLFTRRLTTSHAFHSSMLEPILAEFRRVVEPLNLKPPRIPCISNVTGTWLKPEEAVSPDYWVSHLRQTVRFSEGIKEILAHKDWVLLETGPGKTLSSLAARHPEKADNTIILNTLPGPDEKSRADHYMLSTLAALWLKGVHINWQGYYKNEVRKRVSLPAYAFQKQRFWLDRIETGKPLSGQTVPLQAGKQEDWYYLPSWKRSPLAPAGKSCHNNWLILGEDDLTLRMILEKGIEGITARPAAEFSMTADGNYRFNPGRREDYRQLFAALQQGKRELTEIVYIDTPHEWSCPGAGSGEEGFNSLLYLLQVLGELQPGKKIRLFLVTRNLYDVWGGEMEHPLRAVMAGALPVIPFEYPQVQCRSIDLDAYSPDAITMLIKEIRAENSEAVVAYRGNQRWVRIYENISLPEPEKDRSTIKEKGTYLITGGLGGLGLSLARYLAFNFKARLVLTTRRNFPPREMWNCIKEETGLSDDRVQKMESIKEMEAAGAEVVLFEADVTDLNRMQELINETVRRFGSLDGVLHAAGIPGNGILQLKTREQAAKVLAPKVKGTAVLAEVLKNQPPDFLMLFSSINAHVARPGQADYSGANTFLNHFVHSRELPYHAVSVSWDTWQETGMAASPVPHPLLDHILLEEDTCTVYRTRYATEKHWVLHEHAIMGYAVIPGTAYLEMAAAAYRSLNRNTVFELVDVKFVTPFVCGNDQSRDTYTVLKKQPRGFEFFIVSRQEQPTPHWQLYAQGRIIPGEEIRDGNSKTIGSWMKPDAFKSVNDTPLEKETIGSLQLAYKDIMRGRTKIRAMIIKEKNDDAAASFMEFGPRWQSLEKVWLNRDDGLGFFRLKGNLESDTMYYTLHPGLLDFATSFFRLFTDRGSYLPLSYARISVKHRIPREFYSYIRAAGNRDDQTLHYDITLYNTNFEICAVIEDFTVLKIGDTEKISGLVNPAKPLPFRNPLPEVINERILQIKEVFDENTGSGLSTEEGIEVFRRTLASGFREVIVSRQLLHERMAHNRQKYASPSSRETPGEQTGISKKKHPRPDLLIPYSPPRSHTEKQLVSIWEDALGISGIGINDNFFELGGDSLLISGVHSQFREQFTASDVSVANMLQYPTIADFSAFLSSLENTEEENLDAIESRAEKKKLSLKNRRRRESASA